MNTQNKLSRRQFAGRAVAAAATVSIVPRHVIGKGQTPPSETVTKAVIGVGGMGMGHHRNITGGDVPSGRIVGVCDVDPAKLEPHKEYGYELFTDSDAAIEWAAAGNADA